jgi:hypothetical protein
MATCQGRFLYVLCAMKGLFCHIFILTNFSSNSIFAILLNALIMYLSFLLE